MLSRYTVVAVLLFSLIVTGNLQENSDENQEQTEEPKINETDSSSTPNINGTVDRDGAAEQKAAAYPCTDYRDIPDTVLSDPPSVLNVTSERLEEILQDDAVANRCALVYFYASWSHYSCEYAHQYNALGRAFSSLPVLAVDLLYNDVSNPEYVVLYYPSMSLFFNGTIAKRFDPSKSFEELKSLISSVTGLEPLPNITLSDVDREGPLSTMPIVVENDVLQFCMWYLLATGIGCFFYYLSPMRFIRNLWSRPKTD